MQLAYGNQGVLKLMEAGVLQRKLTINQPGDAFEQEADRVADKVMRMPDPQNAGKSEISRVTGSTGVQRACPECEEELHRSSASIQRLCSHCREQGNADHDEDGNIHAREVPGKTPEIAESTSAQIEAMRGRGDPLPDRVRSFFEPRLGHDFSGVRIHADQQAAESAHQVQALAYTVGRDIVFGAGQFQPESNSGRRLIAHELAHVVQQNGVPNKQNAQTKSTPLSLQRMGDVSHVPAGFACLIPDTPTPTSITDVLFGENSSRLTRTAIRDIDAFVARWRGVSTDPLVRVDGFASTDGPDALNWRLSCDRAHSVVAELVHPTSGGTGIPTDKIDTFAQGETDEFSTTAREPNRRVTISSDLSSAPAAGTCSNPGTLRNLDVQPIFLRTSPADLAPTGTSWARRFAEANTIWGKIGVSFNQLTPVTMDTPLKTTGGSPAERAAIRALRAAAGIEVFIVDNDVADQGGAFTIFGCGPDGNVIMTDRGSSDTLLAHELGHTLGIRHPGAAFNPGDTDTIMKPTGSSSIANPTRNTMVNFNAILCPASTASSCLHPDP
jgi:outer membrane protein OmpA-like peptidoglycan-associated protein